MPICKLKNIIKKNKKIMLLISKFRSKPIINLNNDEFEKRALLSYSVVHFKSKETMAHPNYVESRNLNKILRNLGYIVDVYNNIDDRKIDYNKYDLIIGEGLPISNYFINKKVGDKTLKTIYYGTGAHPFFQTEESYKRGFEFYNKKGFFPKKSLRNVNEKWGISASLCDNYIIIGNGFTKFTYEKYSKNNEIYTIKPPFYQTTDIKYSNKKNPRKFLWFGSYGLVHKGLDVVLETFIKREDLELHVCGYLDREREIIEAYSKELEGNKNIFFHGFLSLNSEKFKKIMEECTFSILMSASEGLSTAIITTMGNGSMIPLINKQSGIDVEYGVVIESNTVNSLEKSINEALKLSKEELKKKSSQAQDYVINNFTEENFRRELKNKIEKCILNARRYNENKVKCHNSSL